MSTDRETAQRRVLEFAASAMSRGDWAAARAWCEIAWMMSEDERSAP